MKGPLSHMLRVLELERRHPVQPRRWQPAADVYRTAEGWLVKLELAGVAPEDICIESAGRRLTIHGRRQDTDVVAGSRYHRLEIAYSEFARSIEFPAALDEAALGVDYREGMLRIHIALREVGP